MICSSMADGSRARKLSREESFEILVGPGLPLEDDASALICFSAHVSQDWQNIP